MRKSSADRGMPDQTNTHPPYRDTTRRLWRWRWASDGRTIATACARGNRSRRMVRALLSSVYTVELRLFSRASPGVLPNFTRISCVLSSSKLKRGSSPSCRVDCTDNNSFQFAVKEAAPAPLFRAFDTAGSYAAGASRAGRNPQQRQRAPPHQLRSSRT